MLGQPIDMDGRAGWAFSPSCIAVLAALLTPLAASAGPDDFLMPTAGRFDSERVPLLSEYHKLLRSKLLEGLPFKQDFPAFEVYVLPSFQEEWYMTFAEASPGNCVQGVISWVEPSLWGAMHRKENVELKQATGCIPYPLFQEVQCAVSSMLARTRYPIGPHGGFDGTTFYFRGFVQHIGMIEGSAWTPKQGSATHNLVRVTYGLSEMLEKPHEFKLHETEVKKALALLNKQLKVMQAKEPRPMQAACRRNTSSR